MSKPKGRRAHVRKDMKRLVKDAHQGGSTPQVELPATSVDHVRRRGSACSHPDESYPAHPQSFATIGRHRAQP